MMGVISIQHSDIKQFITAKQQSNRLSKFNLSVLVPDKFINAVINNEMWDLCFPDTQWQNYKELWDGDLTKWVKLGYPVIVSQTLPARELWDLILRSTYTRNEPGVLFYDTLNDYNPIKYAETILTTNPCLSGDTLVAVADGRNAVSIKELAQKEKDVPVYCINSLTGESSIKMMRNPRITGFDQQVYEVLLDGNFKIKCTKNHKFLLFNGTYKELSQLKAGDLLHYIDTNELSKDLNDVNEYSVDETGLVNKVCQVCENEFKTTYKAREVSVCSIECKNKYLKKDKTIKNFNSQKAIEILSITYIGKQTVYNGTVDEFHNFNLYLNKHTHINNLQCGQIGMSSGVCNLGSLNLPSFYSDGIFDYQSFEQAIKYGVCFLDGVCDVSYVPLKQYEQKIKDFRRIGLGVTGLGSLLSMLGLKFGSQKAIQFVNDIFKFKCQIELLTSALLGKTKGSFLKFNKDEYFSSKWWYELPISYQVKRKIQNIGFMRNATHSDVPPSGNCQIPSSAIKTEQGIKTLKEIFQENGIQLGSGTKQWYQVSKPLKVLTMNGFKKITKLYDNCDTITFKIVTQGNRIIQGTAEHKVLIGTVEKNYWSKLQFLNVGSNLIIKDGYKYTTDKISLITKTNNYTCDIQVEDVHHYILQNGIVSHNSSVFLGQVSNGIEPVFMQEYTRWVSMTQEQKESLGVKYPEPTLGEWFETDIFKATLRGNEQILRGTIDGVTYQIDKGRGMIKPMKVMDYGYRQIKQLGLSQEGLVDINQLSVQDHINMLATSAKYVNQNQSKTINIPQNYSYQQFKDVYMQAWRKKIKGVTTYRAGTMTAVLQDTKNIKTDTEQEEISQLEKLFKRTKENVILSDVKLPNKSYALQYKFKDKNKKKWYFTISCADKELTKPIAIFIRTNNKQSSEVTDMVINSMQKLLLDAEIRKQLVVQQRKKYQGQSNIDKIGRAIGMALRHNIQIPKIVQTLEQHNDGLSTLLFNIRKVLSGFIKDGTKIDNKKCQNCGETSLIYQGGCSTCSTCGHSKCS